MILRLLDRHTQAVQLLRRGLLAEFARLGSSTGACSQSVGLEPLPSLSSPLVLPQLQPMALVVLVELRLRLLHISTRTCKAYL
jgi:hypothetical protein